MLTMTRRILGSRLSWTRLSQSTDEGDYGLMIKQTDTKDDIVRQKSIVMAYTRTNTVDC